MIECKVITAVGAFAAERKLIFRNTTTDVCVEACVHSMDYAIEL